MTAHSPDLKHELVTVVITTKDRPEMLRRSVRSVRDQTHRQIQLVIVDDGSSIPVSRMTIADCHQQTSLVRNDRPTGVCAARNQGLLTARGNWIVFLDDDDELTPTMVETSLQAIQATALPEPVAVLSTMQEVNNEGHGTKRRIPPVLPRGAGYFLGDDQEGRSWLAQNSLLAPTDVVRRIGGWDPQLGAAEHTDFFLRLNAVCSIDGIQAIGYRYHDHGSQHLNQNLLKTALDMERTLQKHWSTFRRNKYRMARYANSCGYYFLRASCWRRSIHWCGNAIRIDPMQGRPWVYLLATLAGPYTRRFIRRIRDMASCQPQTVVKTYESSHLRFD